MLGLRCVSAYIKPIEAINTRDSVMTKEQTLRSVATIENAKAWSAETDKQVFCVELMDYFSINSKGAEAMIDRLESKFERMLANA